MTSEHFDTQHDTLTSNYRHDPAASEAITAGTGLAVKLAFGDGISEANIEQHFTDRLRSFPEHKALFREAFSITSNLIGAAIREHLESKGVADAVA